MHDSGLHPDERVAESQGPVGKRTASVRETAPALNTNPGRRVFNSVVEVLPNVENPSPLVRINRLNTTVGFQHVSHSEPRQNERAAV